MTFEIRNPRSSILTVVSVLVIASLLNTVSAADTVTVSVGAPGFDAMTHIEILRWEGELPVLVGITLPDGDYVLERPDLGVLTDGVWEREHMEPDGWYSGRIFLPTATGSTAYDIRFQPPSADYSRVEFEFWSVGDTSGVARGEIVFAPKRFPDSPAGTHGIKRIARVLFTTIIGCGRAQASAMEACRGAAGEICSGSGVDSAEFSGTCGRGTCRVECNGF